ncbi:hypothetical protein GCM10028802_26770 [Terrabacter terrigena]
MTATTVADVVARVEHLVQELHDSAEPVDRHQWESFDQTIYRFLVTLARTRPLGPGHVDLEALPLLALQKDYPAPLVPADDATEYSPRGAARMLSNPRRTFAIGSRVARCQAAGKVGAGS